MNKIITPTDIIDKDIENSEIVKMIIENLNNQLSEIKSLESRPLKLYIYTTEHLTTHERSLVISFFKRYGWDVTYSVSSVREGLASDYQFYCRYIFSFNTNMN